KREADVDQHPLAGLGRLVGEQADVDDPAHPADVHARQVRLFRQELDHLTGNAKAHVTLLYQWSREPGAAGASWVSRSGARPVSATRPSTTCTASPAACATGSLSSIPQSTLAGRVPTPRMRAGRAAPSMSSTPRTTSGCMPCASKGGLAPSPSAPGPSPGRPSAATSSTVTVPGLSPRGAASMRMAAS